MNKTFYNRVLIIAGFLGAIGVMVGAFGAHFLKERIEAIHINTLNTGVLYLFIHVLGLIGISILGKEDPGSRILRSVALTFVAGVLLFSGSLFLIATQSLTNFPVRFIGFLTPMGGLCFIAGWILIMVYGFSRKS